MLYLKSLVLDKFKSFKHAELLFSRGFTCVVGPNGSGKSVIFDALSFGLGSPTLQELRIDKLDELINRNVKRKQDEPTVSHVKMEFGGDSEAVIVKAVNSESKTSYKLNGKSMSRKEIIEFLSKNGLRVDDTTTIAQGEINRIAMLNSNERRELIDTAAGIKDFEYKKGEALKELDKVDTNISIANATLKEREGALIALEKEKESAENYTKMSQRLKSLRYSVLFTRQKELKASSESYTAEITSYDSKKGEVSKRLVEITSKRDQLSAERQQITGELNKITSTSGETNAKLQAINNELAKLEVEIPALQKSISEGNAFADQSNIEINSAKDKIKAGSSTIDELNKKIVELEKELGKLGIMPEGVDFEKDLKELDTSINDGENKLLDLQSYISQLQSELSLARSKDTDTQKQLEEIKHKSETIIAEVGKKNRELSSYDDQKAGIVISGNRASKEFSSLSKRIYDIDGELLNLKQQYAVAQSREGGVSSKITERFGEKDGFYGRASALCEYDAKYAVAVETAAANRFEYFVVDSMAVANKIIDYLKKNSLGRATFIPISELTFAKADPEKEIVPVIDVIKYQSKFAKVFSWIFNNTYITTGSDEAKKFGIGKHRYVTLTGELIEQSGIISGGSAGKKISLSVLEKKIKELEEEKDSVKTSVAAADESRKEADKAKVLLDMQARTYESEIRSMKSEVEQLLKQQTELNNRISGFVEQEKKLSQEIEIKDKEKLNVITRLNSTKESRNVLYDKFSAVSKGFTKSGKHKEQKDKLDKIRDEIEAHRVKIAEINTEIHMLDEKIKQQANAVTERQKQTKDAKAELHDKDLRKEVLEKSRSSIEAEAKSKSTSSKKAYERLNVIDTDMNKLSTEYGKLDTEAANFDRQSSELKIKMAQVETRFKDITAELATFDKSVEVIIGKREEMEAEATVLNDRIIQMGNVNLRAPESYAAQKQLTEESQGKVSTLQTEKDAVLRMIEEIDSKKLETFMDMLNEVNKNFAKLYTYIFPGKGTIMLDDPSDPLNSGLYIKMIDGKTEIPLKSLSGGQKSMVALILLFSIHLCKKSSLYLFDEVDAALDSENAKKLSKLIKEMSSEAQFIVISHNNSLIVNADTAVGVTMDETKQSTALGVEISSMIKAKPQQ